MNPGPLSRRKFLSQSAGAVAAAGLAGATVRAADAPGNRIRVGMIGCGDRAGSHLEMLIAAAKGQNVQIVACCDVWQVNLKKMAERVKAAFGAEPKTFTRFADLLALTDVDAVTIATPDFAHGPILVAALKAGKDVYVEKPMTIQLPLANEALDLARRNNRVVQVGTQYRSHPAILGVTREVATGVLGKISRVSSAVSFNHPRWKRGTAGCNAADVDWDAYLLDLPKRPFDAGLLREWHLHRETSNGLAGLWMVHYIDATALMLDLKYPKSAVALGDTFVWKDGREHSDTFHAVLDYPDGPLFDWAMNLATAGDMHYGIYGQQGSIISSTGGLADREWILSPKGGPKDSKVPNKKIAPTGGGDHMVNWLECIRSRERPRADIEFGHRHVVASIMAAEALDSGRRQTYDADKREIKPA